MKTKFLDDIERLRGFACLLILIQHIAWICPLRFIYEILPLRLLNGSGAVHLFFAISGFVVTLSLRDKLDTLEGSTFLDKISSAKYWLLSFYKRRFLRIFPTVLFVIVVISIFLTFTESGYDWLVSLLRAPAEIFFGTYNYALESFVSSEKPHLAGVGPFWTLAIEAQFYLLWPLLLLACRNNNKRVVLSLSLGLIFTLVVQPALSAIYGSKYYAIYSNVSELFLGSFFAFMYNGDLKKDSCEGCKKVANLATIFLGMMVWFYPNSLTDKMFFSGIVVTFASVLLVMAAAFVPGSFKIPVLEKVFHYLGSRSFSFYAIQLGLANIVVWFTNSKYFARESLYENDFYLYQFLIFIVAQFIITELMYRFIERPSRKLGENI
ncbi:MAG: acyltransferase [Holosporaceae bacterium]|jgi:peptidoglycan/LPS O-acetylase OafA/YrhL|nr:acyltransferase [Holosporaceae bacterium]